MITHLIQSFAMGGLERMVLSLAGLQASAGYDVQVVAYESDGPMREALLTCGVRASFIRTAPGLRFGLPRRLREVLGSDGVLHTHHVGPALYGMLATLGLRIAHVHTEHSLEFHGRARLRMILRAVDRRAAIVSVSHAVSAGRRAFGLSGGVVIDNGVKIPELETLAEQRVQMRRVLCLSGSDVLVACVARLAPEKDHATLIEGFRRARQTDPRLKLVIVGDGPERDAIKQRVSQRDLRGAVTLAGQQSEPERFFAAADICALNSVREGQPLAVLEAMAAGLPVVATRVGGLVDIVDDNVGALFEASNPDQTACALVAIAQHASTRRCLGAAARARILKRHSLDRMHAQYGAVYASALGVEQKRIEHANLAAH